jgi:hypothetical protein
VDLYYNSIDCFWRDSFLYCRACLVWPSSNNPDATCSFSFLNSGPSTINQVCTGDELSTPLDSSGNPVSSGGINKVAPWGETEQYCQLVRWAAYDQEPKEVLFSVQSGDGQCTRAAQRNMTMTIQVESGAGRPGWRASWLRGRTIAA